MVKYTGRGLVVKRPGVLSKVQIWCISCLGGGGLFPSSNSREFRESRGSRESPDCGKQRRI